LRSRHANGRAPDRLAPLCPRGRDVGACHRGVEHLHQVRALAQRCERIEKGLKDAASAQPPEAFPDRIPMAELHRKGAPSDVVDRKIMQRLQKLPVVPSFVATARAHRPENLQNNRPVILGHRRQHGRPSEIPTAHESLKNRFGNRLASLSPPNPALRHVSLDASAYALRNPSTRPSIKVFLEEKLKVLSNEIESKVISDAILSEYLSAYLKTKDQVTELDGQISSSDRAELIHEIVGDIQPSKKRVYIEIAGIKIELAPILRTMDLLAASLIKSMAR